MNETLKEVTDPVAEYMAAIDPKGKSFVFWIKLGLSRDFSEEEVASAWRVVIEAYPKLKSSVRISQAEGRLYFHEDPHPDLSAEEAVIRARTSSFASASIEGIPISQAPIWRYSFRLRELVFGIHHSLADGGGAFQILDAFLLALSGERKLGAELQAAPKTQRSPLGKKWDMYTLLAEKTWNALFDPAVMLGDPKHRDLSAPWWHHEFSAKRETLEALRKTFLSAGENITLNDLFLAGVHRALGNLKDSGKYLDFSHGGSSRVSTVVPVNLRPDRHRQYELMNIVADVNISSSPRDRLDEVRLLKKISSAMKRARGRNLWYVLRDLTQPWIPSRGQSSWRFFETCAFTNLGPVALSEKAQALLESVVVFPSIFPPMSLAISVNCLRDVLRFGISGSSSMISEETFGAICKELHAQLGKI